MKLKIDDVARLAQVSKATVSAVLNDKPGVAEKTRIRVLEIIERFNYKPNHVARALSLQATKSVGLVIKEIDNPYYTKIMRGVFHICSLHGYSVFLGSSELQYRQEEKIIEAFVNQQVDGLIVTPLQEADRDFSTVFNLINRKFPIVTIGRIKNFHTNCVSIDNVAAAQEAVSYLIRAGHKRIAYFAGPANSLHNDDRLLGYRRALITAGIELPTDYIVAAGANFADGFSQCEVLFDREFEQPTAVFCYNDLVAIGLIQALQNRGVRVPQEIAVIGFDNIDFSRFSNIPLTTVSNPARKMGEEAAKLLLRQIEKPDPVLFKEKLLETTLVVRNSA